MFVYPDIDKKIMDDASSAEKALSSRYKKIDEICEANTYKILKAFEKNKISEAHFSSSTGYGYNDMGRDAIEAIYADIFHAEDALVRSQITCGTQAIYLCMQAVLLPEDELLFISGAPYDSLYSSVGITDAPCSLAESKITHKIVELENGRDFDKEAIKKAINEHTKMIHIQRSKGYSIRDSLSIEKTSDIISFIREISKDIIINVDNCYCEFCDTKEPTDVGADLCEGSLIKNPGGGIAPYGGYIVGRKNLIERCANKLTAPGLGKEVGASSGFNKSVLQGLSLASKTVSSAMKNAYFAAYMAERSGYETFPDSSCEHSCIVQAIKLNDPEKVKKFCTAIQNASFVDNFVKPEDFQMPGYEDNIIMASGSFVAGSSIELSCDGPMREPFVVYFQGGLTHEQGKYAIIKAMNALLH